MSVVFRLNECPINRPREGVSCARRYLRTALRSAPAFAGLNAWPPGRTHSSRFPRGFFLRSALSRLLFSSISSVCGPAWGGASCARPVVLVRLPPSLEVGPRVVGLCSLFSLLAAGALAAPCLCGGCFAAPLRGRLPPVVRFFLIDLSRALPPTLHTTTIVQSRAPGQTPTLGCSDGSGDASGTVARPATRFAERRCMACRGRLSTAPTLRAGSTPSEQANPGPRGPCFAAQCLSGAFVGAI